MTRVNIEYLTMTDDKVYIKLDDVLKFLRDSQEDATDVIVKSTLMQTEKVFLALGVEALQKTLDKLRHTR